MAGKPTKKTQKMQNRGETSRDSKGKNREAKRHHFSKSEKKRYRIAIKVEKQVLTGRRQEKGEATLPELVIEGKKKNEKYV